MASADAGEESRQTYATLKRMTGGGNSFLTGLRRHYIRKLIDADAKADA